MVLKFAPQPATSIITWTIHYFITNRSYISSDLLVLCCVISKLYHMLQLSRHRRVWSLGTIHQSYSYFFTERTLNNYTPSKQMRREKHTGHTFHTDSLKSEHMKLHPTDSNCLNKPHLWSTLLRCPHNKRLPRRWPISKSNNICHN